MSQDNDCPACEEGLPPWLATFADLMSLLMCFFVLLLSFATIDAVRFKKMAESMKDAFGVQREVPANEIANELGNPRGANMVALGAYVGATGAVGGELLRLIQERQFPFDSIKVLASSRSQGKRLPFGDGDLVVGNRNDQGRQAEAKAFPGDCAAGANGKISVGH